MGDGEDRSAAALLERYRAIPKDVRSAAEAWSIRIWRSLSWLERAEAATDTEGRFISCWIAFNAAYGHLDDDGRDAHDRSSWQSFLARLVLHDAERLLEAQVEARQKEILSLIDNRYLFKPFWLKARGNGEMLHRSIQRVLQSYVSHDVADILRELFERLYVLRTQVFHGAATCGSRLNRPAIEAGTAVLADLVPAMVAVLLNAGSEIDWGELCFPPIKTEEPPPERGRRRTHT